MNNKVRLCPFGHAVQEKWLEHKNQNDVYIFSGLTVNLPIASDQYIEQTTITDDGVETQQIPMKNLTFQIFVCWSCVQPYWDYQCQDTLQENNYQNNQLLGGANE